MREIGKDLIFPIGVRLCDYDRCVREPFDIGEDRTRKHRNYTIEFIRLWVLFMFLPILYFKMLDDIGKMASLFSRRRSIAL